MESRLKSLLYLFESNCFPGVAYNSIGRINDVTLRRARLVLIYCVGIHIVSQKTTLILHTITSRHQPIMVFLAEMLLR